MKGALDYTTQALRHVIGQGRRVVTDYGPYQGDYVRLVIRQSSGQHLIKNNADRPNIRLLAALAVESFWSHVSERTSHAFTVRTSLDEARYAEVRQSRRLTL